MGPPQQHHRRAAAPLHRPILFRPLLQSETFRHCLRFGEAGKETPGLLRPSARHLPPAKTTNRALRRGPTSSFSLRRRASAKTAPSMLATWGRGEPSQCNGDTKWQAICQDQPTLVTKIRSRDVKVTLAPPSRQMRAPTLSTTKPRTCSSMVAQSIKRTVTTTLTCRKRKRRRRLSKRTRKRCESIRFRKLDGGGKRHSR